MLPKTAEYALRAAVWLGQEPGHAASADDLAEATQVPRRYLYKDLQDLEPIPERSGRGGQSHFSSRRIAEWTWKNWDSPRPFWAMRLTEGNGLCLSQRRGDAEKHPG